MSARGDRWARRERVMKAIAVIPGKPNSMHLRDVPMPRVEDVPDGRGVLVRVLRVGVDGTDKEINPAEYGQAPEGDDYLIPGHENFGQVVAVGPNVPPSLQPGGYVVATVRRPGSSIYDRIGLQDMTTDDVYYERGINQRHGYLAEYYVEDASYIVPLPGCLEHVGVLIEPLTVAEKGVGQAYEIQRRLKVWEPRRAAVLGSGTIGLLATLVLRLRGLEVVCYSQRPRPVPEQQPRRGAGRALRERRPGHAGRDRRPARPVRPHLRGNRLQSTRVRGGRGARQEWRAGAGERHGRRAHRPGSLRSDQPGLRAWQQGDGGHRERVARRLRERRGRPGAGGGSLPRVAGAAAHDSGARPGAVRGDAAPTVREPRRDQGLRRGGGAGCGERDERRVGARGGAGMIAERAPEGGA